MKSTLIAIAALAFASAAMASQTIELKDGGKIIVDEKGTYPQDAKGKRVRMKDGVIMEGKDGQKYVMKNDAIWKQITEKGTLAPNR